MNSIVYVGMDVHKECYTACCYSFDTDKVMYQQKLPADCKMILKYLEQLRNKFPSDHEIVCGYEAGCLGYSLYHRNRQVSGCMAFYYKIMEVFQIMSTYNARVPADQQCQLTMECRSSGLTDYQWCKEQGIHPGTFYNWVSHLRKPVMISRIRFPGKI